MPGEDDKTKTGGEGAATTTTTTDKKPAVSFDTLEEFHREIDRKSKAAVGKALESFKAGLFEKLGVESEDDLPKLTEQIAASAKTVTEAEKLKGQLDKVIKEHGKAKERGDALQAKLKGIAKRDALAPFLAKVRDPEVLTMLADKQLEVDDEGVVTVKDGGKLDDMVEGLLKAKEYLRIPATAQGAGTTATEPRKPADDASKGNGNGQSTTTATDGKGTPANDAGKQSFGQMMANAIKESQVSRPGP